MSNLIIIWTQVSESWYFCERGGVIKQLFDI